MSPSSAPEQLESLWSFFPMVMCINLRERNDRYQEARSELQRIGLRRVTFVRTERQPDRDKAIIDAHMACLRHAVARGVPHFLVFEDDVLFQDNTAASLRRSVDFMKSRPDWNVFYFGGFIFRKVERLDSHLLRGAVLTTHAYVMRTEFARRVLERRPYCTGMSVDLFYSSMLGDNAFVHVNPLICIQRPSGSDGTWDKRSLNKEGWLGNAMLYTALDFKDRLRFRNFSLAERMRVQNGIMFFKVYRWIQRRKLDRAEAHARQHGARVVQDDGPPAVLQEEVLC
jgi:hypothetical protein